MIEAALKETRGRVSGPAGAAVKLGIPRSTLEIEDSIPEDRQESLQKLDRQISSAGFWTSCFFGGTQN